MSWRMSSSRISLTGQFCRMLFSMHTWLSCSETRLLVSTRPESHLRLGPAANQAASRREHIYIPPRQPFS